MPNQLVEKGYISEDQYEHLNDAERSNLNIVRELILTDKLSIDDALELSSDECSKQNNASDITQEEYESTYLSLLSKTAPAIVAKVTKEFADYHQHEEEARMMHDDDDKAHFRP